MPPMQLSASYPSPKRKRDAPPFVPHLNTTLRRASTPPRGSQTPPGADSPRNAVAEQLRGMSIAAIPMSPLTPTEDVVRKKPKLQEADEAPMAGIANPPSRIVTWKPTKKQAFSSAEAPPKNLATNSSDDALVPSNATSAQASVLAVSSSETAPSSNPTPESPSPPLISLTWQDSEITGHLVNPSDDPDDDGTGLNGIGFRPTPAMAYQRTQKRKQQLMDWRAREAREARAKRSERRRRGIGGAAMGSREGTVERETIAAETEAASRRAVRFAI